jgi:hypothetical protein
MTKMMSKEMISALMTSKSGKILMMKEHHVIVKMKRKS